MRCICITFGFRNVSSPCISHGGLLCICQIIITIVFNTIQIWYVTRTQSQSIVTYPHYQRSTALQMFVIQYSLHKFKGTYKLAFKSIHVIRIRGCTCSIWRKVRYKLFDPVLLNRKLFLLGKYEIGTTLQNLTTHVKTTYTMIGSEIQYKKAIQGFRISPCGFFSIIKNNFQLHSQSWMDDNDNFKEYMTHSVI